MKTKNAVHAHQGIAASNGKVGTSIGMAPNMGASRAPAQAAGRERRINPPDSNRARGLAPAGGSGKHVQEPL
jgi:hypothetical protein